MKKLIGTIYFFIAIATAMRGYRIHSSVFWTIIDFIFWPLALAKWVIMHQINMTIIHDTFSFFIK